MAHNSRLHGYLSDVPPAEFEAIFYATKRTDPRVLHDGVKINLIDTPGDADFVGELRAGLRAADCALFVIAANEGVDAPTRALWHECNEVAMPRAVVVTKLDGARADYPAILAAAQQAFGD